MSAWELVLAIAAGVVLGVVAVVVLAGVLTILAALLYRAWYFTCIEWPDSFRWWLRKRRDAKNGKGENS